ncbi:envelope stress response protein PspG [Photobacterium sp.]|uniref:envelope stress response protein PspG n=1 Tax=Photobacterium sp. TaxID=660 RepID=UPI00299E3D1A|nr:envelope stress response protein PspG [Photobacterium sp.]MDX1304479.1 envelope stress response protein PspG [Photobacterium sp.]
MIEFLFLIVFAVVLVFTGISMMGVVIAVMAGFAIMAVAGMIGVVFKLLPWIILIAVVVWFYRKRKAEQCHRTPPRYRRRY